MFFKDKKHFNEFFLTQFHLDLSVLHPAVFWVGNLFDNKAFLHGDQKHKPFSQMQQKYPTLKPFLLPGHNANLSG